MKLFIITGLSGAGKTNALRIFEDNNFYCIDNLPATLLKNVLDELSTNNVNSIAISIDSRSINIDKLPDILSSLNSNKIDFHLIYLSASKEQLVSRFSESRRKHPLIKTSQSLAQAIENDQKIINILPDNFIHICTDNMTLNHLNIKISELIHQKTDLHLHLISFAFKKGVPLDVDFLFDVRELPNPYYDKSLKDLNGLDEKLKMYFLEMTESQVFINDTFVYLEKRLENLMKSERKYIAAGFGCTGGKHRSVYVANEVLNLTQKNKLIKSTIYHRDVHA